MLYINTNVMYSTNLFISWTNTTGMYIKLWHRSFFLAGLLYYANMNDESLAENIVYVAFPNLLATE